jgi:hypothetical protein
VGGAVISLGLGVPGTALATGPTVIGFDDLAVGAPVADQYSATDGVRFGSVLTFGATLPGFNGCGAPSVAAAVSAASSPNAAQAPRCDTPGGFAEGTLAAFSFPRRTVSVKISSGASASPVTDRLVAYNAAGVAVATTTGVLVNLRVTLSVSRPSADVAYAAISFDAPVDTTTPLYLDDLTLDNTAAPLTAMATPFGVTAATAFSGEVARIQDADPTAVAGDFTATVAWADATTSAGTIAAAGSGVFTVSATHTYATAGSFAPVISVTKSNGRTATVTSAATVGAAGAPPPPPPPRPPPPELQTPPAAIVPTAHSPSPSRPPAGSPPTPRRPPRLREWWRPTRGSSTAKPTPSTARCAAATTRNSPPGCRPAPTR